MYFFEPHSTPDMFTYLKKINIIPLKKINNIQSKFKIEKPYSHIQLNKLTVKLNRRNI